MEISEKIHFLIEYTKLYKVSEFRYGDIKLFSSIIASFSEKEVLVLYKLEVEQQILNNYLIKRVANDLRYRSCTHTKFIEYIISQYKESSDKRIRYRSSHFIKELLPLVQSNKSFAKEITEFFLCDEDNRIRNRAYKLIEDMDLFDLYDMVESNWVKYNDMHAVPIILKYASKEFLLTHFRELEQTGYNRKLYRRFVEFGELDFILKYLYQTDKVTYLYFCACNNIRANREDIESIYRSNKNMEDPQKMLWSIGKFGRIDLLMDYCSHSKDLRKNRQHTPPLKL